MQGQHVMKKRPYVRIYTDILYRLQNLSPTARWVYILFLSELRFKRRENKTLEYQTTEITFSYNKAYRLGIPRDSLRQGAYIFFIWKGQIGHKTGLI